MDEKLKQKIIKLRKSGMMPKEIGKKINVDDIQQIRMICYQSNVSKKSLRKDLAYKQWLSKLENDAKIYWEEHGNEPKDEVAKLLIPLLGHDDCSTLLSANAILYRSPHLKRFLRREMV